MQKIHFMAFIETNILRHVPTSMFFLKSKDEESKINRSNMNVSLQIHCLIFLEHYETV